MDHITVEESCSLHNNSLTFVDAQEVISPTTLLISPLKQSLLFNLIIYLPLTQFVDSSPLLPLFSLLVNAYFLVKVLLHPLYRDILEHQCVFFQYPILTSLLFNFALYLPTFLWASSMQYQAVTNVAYFLWFWGNLGVVVYPVRNLLCD